MTSDEKPRILPAALCFLVVCLLLYTGLIASGASRQTFLDEVALVAMGFFVGSCALSYAGMRIAKKAQLSEAIALVSFLIGLLAFGVGLLAYTLEVI